MAEQYPFLSNDWMDAAKRIRDEMPHPEVPSVGLMKMNLVVTASPFEAGDIKAHVDTSDGEIIVEHGHLDGPDLTVTVEYDVAKALFVDLDVTAAMQAFMAGKVKVQGDITKLMALGAPGAAAEPDENAVAIAKAIRDIHRVLDPNLRRLGEPLPVGRDGCGVRSRRPPPRPGPRHSPRSRRWRSCARRERPRRWPAR